jgi:DNA-binding CsgD family transcriptional regulator
MDRRTPAHRGGAASAAGGAAPESPPAREPEGTGVAPHLAPEEALTLQLCARGYSREQVAAFLGATTEAVAAYERDACAALGARGIVRAVARAAELGLVSVGANVRTGPVIGARKRSRAAGHGWAV